MQVNMQVGQKFTITLTPVPPNGVVDGPPAYADSTSGIVAVAPAADGMSAVVTAMTAGTDVISVSGKSLGNPIAGDDTVNITVVPAPVPATALHVAVSVPV